jgi:hypothetical protein
VLGQDALTEGIDFAEANGCESGSFEAKAEPSNAAEKIEDSHHFGKKLV